MGSEGPVVQGRGLTLGDYVFGSLTAAMALLVVGVLGVIVVLLLVESNLSIQTFGLQFLTGTIWQPVAPEKYSALVFVYGTLYTSALAMLFGIPVSIGVAIFLTELSPRWMRVVADFTVRGNIKTIIFAEHNTSDYEGPRPEYRRYLPASM